MSRKTFDEHGATLMAWLESPGRRLVAAAVLAGASMAVSAWLPMGWAL